MIPTRTGAALTIGKVLPHLKGRVTCSAIRVPTATVSLLDLVVQSKRATNRSEVNGAIHRASAGKMKEILAISDEPLVSVDYKRNPHSAVIDALSTGTNGSMIRILAWYDNEWAYSMRLIETLRQFDRSDQVTEVPTRNI